MRGGGRVVVVAVGVAVLMGGAWEEAEARPGVCMSAATPTEVQEAAA